MRNLRYNEAIILTLFLLAIFVGAFIWWLYRNCVQVVQTEAAHMELEMREKESGAAATGKGGEEGKVGK